MIRPFSTEIHWTTIPETAIIPIQTPTVFYATRCGAFNSIWVGSFPCTQCEFFIGKDNVNRVVECHSDSKYVEGARI